MNEWHQSVVSMWKGSRAPRVHATPTLGGRERSCYMRKKGWEPTDYHPLSHNCNCFCKQFAKFAGVSVPPYWVKQVGHWAAPLAPRCVVACGVVTWDNGVWSLGSVL